MDIRSSAPTVWLHTFVPICVHYLLSKVYTKEYFLHDKMMCTLNLDEYDSHCKYPGDLSRFCLSLPYSVFYVIKRFCCKIK